MDMTMPKPRAEHAFLERLVGRWQVTAAEMSDGNDWIEEVRSLRGIWFLAEGRGTMPGGGLAMTQLTLGHDSATGRYVGSWIGSMMEHLWVYDGELSGDGNTLSLYTTGPSCTDAPGLQDYREQLIFSDDDRRSFVASTKEPDGNWKPCMQASYLRLA